MAFPRYAVQYGKTVDRGAEGGEIAFPFIYGFIPRDRDTWDQVKNPATFADLADIGPVIGPGSKADIGVTLDADFNFKLLRIKYTVYALETRGAPPYFYWHDSTVAFLDQYQPMAAVHSRLERKLRINVLWMPQGEYLYGSQNSFAQTTNTLPTVPLVIAGAQGNEYGPGQVNTPVLLPANGLLRFEVYNDNPESIVVGAAIIGLKVRL